MIKGFKEMFQKHRVPPQSNTNYLTVGKILPENLMNISNKSPWLLGAISLSCMKCIDLLPKISEIANSYKGEFILVTDGSIEDIDEIKDYFGFEFNIISFGDELIDEGGFQETPSFCLIDENNRITAMRVIDDIENAVELLSILEGESN
ncbi:hypothetical protein [Bacillus cereus]|uniref:hypothetical protein n=1 Tax=Bacillus cereus TaxID=1396 RepID=UPI00144437FB|nr:hypothetical protein [Bacillus cereus]NKX61713.1 hypothetical protein [Bacillus cereus]